MSRPRRSSGSADEVTATARELLRPWLQRRVFAAREALWSEGTEGRLLVSIERGRVKIFRGSPAVTMFLFGPGDTFGFLPFLDGRPYPASAQAITEVEAWVMEREALVEAFSTDPGVALALVGLLANRLRLAFQRIEQSATPEVLPRVAGVLVALLPARATATTVVELPVSGQELAAAIDVVPESFSRAVTAMVKAGVLHRLGTRRFQVLDVARLRDAARAPPAC